MKFKDLFKKPTEELNEKWYVIGFFSCLFFLVYAGFPFLFWSSWFRDSIVPFHNATYMMLSLIPVVIWGLFVMWKSGVFMNFSTNCAILFWKDYEQDKLKKPKKETWRMWQDSKKEALQNV